MSDELCRCLVHSRGSLEGLAASTPSVAPSPQTHFLCAVQPGDGNWEVTEFPQTSPRTLKSVWSSLSSSLGSPLSPGAGTRALPSPGSAGRRVRRLWGSQPAEIWGEAVPETARLITRAPRDRSALTWGPHTVLGLSPERRCPCRGRAGSSPTPAQALPPPSPPRPAPLLTSDLKNRFWR